MTDMNLFIDLLCILSLNNNTTYLRGGTHSYHYIGILLAIAYSTMDPATQSINQQQITDNFQS